MEFKNNIKSKDDNKISKNNLMSKINNTNRNKILKRKKNVLLNNRKKISEKCEKN